MCIQIGDPIEKFTSPGFRVGGGGGRGPISDSSILGGNGVRFFVPRYPIPQESQKVNYVQSN